MAIVVGLRFIMELKSKSNAYYIFGLYIIFMYLEIFETHSLPLIILWALMSLIVGSLVVFRFLGGPFIGNGTLNNDVY